MKLRLHSRRSQIIACAVLLMIVVQLILAGAAWSFVRGMSVNVKKDTTAYLFNQAKVNSEMLFKDLNDWAYFFDGPRFSYFMNGYQPLRSNDGGEAIRLKFGKMLDELNLPDRLIDTVYFIGADSNLGVYSKQVGVEGAMFDESEDVPDMNLLGRSGLLSLLRNQTPNFSYYGKDQLTTRIAYPRTFPAALKSKVDRFAKRLEGKVILNNGGISGYLVVLTLRPDFMEMAIAGSELGSFALTDMSGNRIWTQKAIPDSIKRDSLMNETDITLSHFKLLYQYPNANDNSLDLGLVMKFAIMSIGSIAFSFAISFAMTSNMANRLRLFTMYIRKQGNSIVIPRPFKPRPGKLSPSAMALKHQIFLIFCIVLVLPGITNGFAFARFLQDTSQTRFARSVESIADQLQTTVSLQMRHFEKVMFTIYDSGQIQQLLTSVLQIPISSPTAALYTGWNDGSYFILYNENGGPLYATVFPSTLNPFPLDFGQIDRKETSARWLTGQDANNLQMTSILKPYRLAADHGPGAGSVNGSIVYLQYVIREHAFLENIEPLSSYAIRDKQQRPIMSGGLLAKDLESFNPAVLPVNGGKWLTIQQAREYTVSVNLPGTDGWTLQVFRSYEEMDYKTRELVYRYVLMIVGVLILSVLIANRLAILLTKPLEQLKKGMELVSKGNLAVQLNQRGNDEIDELIGSYNQMVLRIRSLLEDNTRMSEEQANAKLREQELITLKSKAELHILQQQINPHFLYNTLEVINMQSIRSGVKEISVMVSTLAKIFRYGVQLNEDLVPLETEIDYARNYIHIQQIRLGDKLKVEWSISDEAMKHEVIKFIVQPLIENAVKYGMFGFQGQVTITVNAEVKEGLLVIRVADTGLGMSTAVLQRVRSKLTPDAILEERIVEMEGNTGSGIGLGNIFKRLHLYYEGRAEMRIESRHLKGTTVEIRLPVTRLKEG